MLCRGMVAAAGGSLVRAGKFQLGRTGTMMDGFRIWICAVVMLFAASCGFTPQGDVIRDAIKARGSAAMDEGLTNSIWFICHGASVGSIKRRFGSSMKTYNALCSGGELK